MMSACEGISAMLAENILRSSFNDIVSERKESRKFSISHKGNDKLMLIFYFTHAIIFFRLSTDKRGNKHPKVRAIFLLSLFFRERMTKI